jgi:hypothetical protein
MGCTQTPQDAGAELAAAAAAALAAYLEFAVEAGNDHPQLLITPPCKIRAELCTGGGRRSPTVLKQICSGWACYPPLLLQCMQGEERVLLIRTVPASLSSASRRRRATARFCQSSLSIAVR